MKWSGATLFCQLCSEEDPIILMNWSLKLFLFAKANLHFFGKKFIKKNNFPKNFSFCID